MPLALPRPMKRPGSSIHQFVQRIPADVIDKVRGMTLAIPIGETVVARRVSTTAPDIRVPLGTRDPAEAKARHARVVNYLHGVWRAVREGPRRLTHKETEALAGEAYRAWTDAFHDDPGSPDMWASVTATNIRAATGNFGRAAFAILPDDERRAKALAERFGSFADAALARYGLIVAEESRDRLIEALGRAVTEAGETNLARASGDYSPDTTRSRFPEWVPPQAVKATDQRPTGDAAGVTLSGLMEAWWREAKAAGRSVSTHQSYSATVAKLAAFLDHDDARRVSPEDVVRFKDYRLAELNPRTGKPVSAKTVKDSDLTALKAVFGWAVVNRLVPSNPAEGITIKLGKPKRIRPKGFTDAEAAALLQTATERQPGRESPKTHAARRWVPWLQAYTGARVGEMAQLRKCDLRREGDEWVITVTPEAGTVKGGQARDVPLHRHLVELGFPVFVGAASNGHLFLDPAKGGDVLGPLQGVKNRLSEFARDVVSDPNVQPTHGWRHRFKTIGRELEIADRVLDAIQGHAARTAGDDYGDVTVKAMARALTLFPRQG